MDTACYTQGWGGQREGHLLGPSPLETSSGWLKLERFPWRDGRGEMDTRLSCLNLEGEQKPFFLYNFSYCLEFCISGDSWQSDTIRGDVSALHGVSLPAAPLLRHPLAPSWLQRGCWLDVPEVHFEKAAMTATWIVGTKLISLFFFFLPDMKQKRDPNISQIQRVSLSFYLLYSSLAYLI